VIAATAEAACLQVLFRIVFEACIGLIFFGSGSSAYFSSKQKYSILLSYGMMR
jgi:hypothetical protein